VVAVLPQRRWTVGGFGLIAVLAIAGIVLVAVRPAATTDGDPSTASGPSFLFLGDSLSANYYASSAANGYRELVTSETGGREVAFVGAAGETTSEVLGQLLATPRTGADTVVVEVGTNDLIHQTSLSLVEVRYAQLIHAALVRSVARARLFCLGLWSTPALAPEVTQFDAVLQHLCTAAGGHWVPLGDLFLDPADRGPAGTATYLGVSDNYHPNDTGHRAIAERLAAAVRAARP
jgi:lysophospholipase L1-like esterase